MYISILKKVTLLYGCLLFFTALTFGQLNDYHVQKLPGKNGLIQPNQVEEMMRDSKGFLWLLTSSKAQRFDGKNILSFTFDDRCIGIQEDDLGTVWIASLENIYRFKNDYTEFEKLTAYSSSSTKYLSLLSGPAKKLYLLTTEGIVRWNQTTNKMEPFGIAPFKNSRNFSLLKSCGNLLFFTMNSNLVVRYNTLTLKMDSVRVQQPNYLVPLNDDNVWMRQGIGSTVLVSFKTKAVKPLDKTQFAEKFSDNNFFITDAFEGRSGEFFTTIRDKGYFTYNSITNRFNKVNFINNGRLLGGRPLLTRNNFFKEKNGTAWFTNEEGFFLLNPYTANIRLLRSTGTGNGADEQWNNDVRNLTEDNQGNIWFGTANGFCKWDKTNGKVTVWHPDYTATNYLNYSSVKSIGFSNNKIIIGQSEKGFWIFDPVMQTFSRPKFESDSLQKKFEKGFNANMLQLHNGNFLVMSGELWLIDKNTFYVKHVKAPEAALISRKAYEDAQRRIWLLGSNGLVAMDNNFAVLYSLAERGKWYNAIVQINDSTFWAASKSLYEIRLLPHRQLSIKSIFPEFASQHFSNLFKDSIGHFWMCSDEGMYRYIPEKNITEKFDQSDNIQNFYTGVSNSFRGSDGFVYFGSLNGINYFSPEEIQIQNDSLQVHLLNVSVNPNNTSFRLHDSFNNLKYYQNSVAFEFVSPYLYNPEKVQYRYKLSDDEDWVNNGSNTAVNFNALKPGNYSFRVAASVNGKDWFDMNKSFDFSIKPPFWRTWWFVSLLLITVAGLSVFLFKKRVAFIKKNEAVKTVLQQVKAAGYRDQLEIEQIINHFATSINNISTVDDLLWDVVKNCISKLKFEDCVIYLMNDQRDALVQKAAWGPKTTEENLLGGQISKIINPIEIPLGKGIVGFVAKTGKPEIIADTSLDERYIVDDAIRFSEIAIPIINKAFVIGVIDSEHSQKNFYTERHLQILQTIAALCAGKIETIRAEKQTTEKEMELLRLNKDFATSQLTALRMQMNPHFIFNALNSIQHYILQGNVVEANKYLSKFSKLQREILHCSSEQFISLEKELEILNTYLELEQFRFGKSFTYKINVHDEIEPVEISIPPMILQPFVENAIWHGLMPLQTDRNLSIFFDLETDDILLATLRDNGIGRNASAKLKENSGENKIGHQSKGMSMVQQRLQLLQQQYDKPFEVIISDIKGINGEVHGTEVILKIFIGNKKINRYESINNR